MDQESLVTEEIEAGLHLAGEFKKSRNLNAAFWLKDPD